MRLRSGDGNIGDFNAIIALRKLLTRSWGAAGLIGVSIAMFSYFLGRGADDGKIAGMIKARSNCGAALDEGRAGEQGFRDGLQTIDHGILKAWCTGGALSVNACSLYGS